MIGGGPAGLAAAIAARQKGLRAIVADGSVPPIDKPCGEGLMAETQAALGDLGVSADDLGGYPVRGIRFVQRHDHVAAAFPKGRGIGIRRTILHEMLVKRAGDCGVQFLWNTPVSGILQGGVRTSRGLVNAKWIVGADGSGSRVRRWSGLDANHARSLRHATRRHYLVTPWTEFVEIYWGERCQAYVTTLSSQEVCIVLTAADAQEADFGVALQNWPQLQQRLAGAELRAGNEVRLLSCTAFATLLMEMSRWSVILPAVWTQLPAKAFGSASARQLRSLRRWKPAICVSYERAHKKLTLRPALMGN